MPIDTLPCTVGGGGTERLGYEYPVGSEGNAGAAEGWEGGPEGAVC